MLRFRLLAVPLIALIVMEFLPPPAEAAPRQSSRAEASRVSAAGRQSPRVVRVATFNVRTARARQDGRRWLRRAPDVAREILSRNPGVVALQELGPGRADGHRGRLKGHVRQTTSLTNSLRRQGGGRYRLVRSTAYVRPGTRHGTQGARILYDSSRYRLVSRCRETTGRRAYNRSCSFELPLGPGDGAKLRRSAAYAEFADRRTGRRFFVVSAHLDHRHSRNNRLERRYNHLRARQAAAVARTLARVNRRHRPVIFGGDVNSWRTDRSRYAPYRALAARGYRDAANARLRVNYAYPTINHWRVRMRRYRPGFGPRLDVVMVKGARGVRRYENKMARVDRARPSDHNMGVADIVL